MEKKLNWHKVLENTNLLPEGRVTTVTAEHTSICLTHHKGKFTALDNKCPHQGGPLGEGSIENGQLRCPWHGWDFCPHGGSSDDYDDALKTFPIKIESDAIYIGLEPEPEHKPTVSDVMIQTLVNWGIDTVFGMVGHSNLGVADAMRRMEAKGKLNFIGIRHEGAAAFAASGYAKLTGKPAACFGIAGPGSTNMYTGMWDAKVDRVPLLAMTGQVDTQVIGTGTFQEVDLVKAFESVTVFNHAVHQNSNYAELMSQAIRHTLIKRDVAHITFPDEVAFSEVDEKSKAQTREGRITSFEIAPPEAELEEAVALLKKAERPIIIIGHGARHYKEAIVAFAESKNIPVVTTFKGKGLISDQHPLACGVLGRSGTPIASWFMNESDLILVLGASFSKHTGITPKKKIIQVDYDPLALSKFHKIEVALYGHINRTLQVLVEKLKDKKEIVNTKEEIAERWKIWHDEKSKRMLDNQQHGLSSIEVVSAFAETVEDNAVVALDVGNNTYSFGRYFECKKQSFLMSGYLGSIGFALPAAMGAWAAVKGDRPVWSFSGDGGLGQYLTEITTLVKYNMNIKHIVLNNSELGKISKEQKAAELDVWHTSLHNPNFAKYAENCGALGIRVDKKEDLKAALLKIKEHKGPALLEVITDVNLI